MGKEDHRSRMILGRSAFQPLDSESAVRITERSRQSDLHLAAIAGGTNAGQLYDDKGRPLNPAKHELCERIRYAQNEILSISGVVERTSIKPDAADQKYHARTYDVQHDGYGIINTIAYFSRSLLVW